MQYRNTSVFGGFDCYVRHWIEEAKKSTNIQDFRTRLQEIESLFCNYRHATFPRREQIYMQSQVILTDLSQDCEKEENRRISTERAAEEGRKIITPEKPATESRKIITSEKTARTKKEIISHVKDRFVQKLESPVQYAKGVGPQLAKKMKKMDISTIEELLYHFPRRYEDRSRLIPIREVRDGEFETVAGTVVKKTDMRPKRGLTISKVTIHDGTAHLTLVWFNQPFRASHLQRGTELYASGKIERRYNEILMSNPEYELKSDEDTLHTGRIVPIYPSTENLSQRVLRKIMKQNLDLYVGSMEDLLPLHLRRAYDFKEYPDSLYAMHFPGDFDELGDARNRLVYEELFFLQLGLLLLKKNRAVVSKNRSYRIDSNFVSAFETQLPFLFTRAQKAVLLEIMQDLKNSTPMSRLTQGDVGSGKTVVAACAIQAAVLSGFQGGVMAPTEILAEQHYKKFSQLLEPAGIKVGLLIGSLPRKEKETVHSLIREGELEVIIGTHALIQDEVLYKNLGLVVIDEQHRFGVMQRAELQKKGNHPDMLVMTATPIPRTLALTLYGDLDISVIDELPPGRSKIKSKWYRFGDAHRVYDFVRKEVSRGRQAYIVCPLIEESDKIAARAATREAEILGEKYFSDLRVGLLHGKLKGPHKEEIMRGFRDGVTDILISTTVIEVGVDVPNATVMVIQNADRFGMAQLHQLRGRVGRGAHQSYCFFISDAVTEESMERMKVMEEHEDGFVIAEKDLQIRGPGDFYGTRQHGLPELKIADLLRDHNALVQARRDAEDLIATKPHLLQEQGLRKRLLAHFANAMELFH